MSLLAKLEAKLADPTADHGTPCRWCHESALACQVEFVSSGERRWCCPRCKGSGAATGHKTVEAPYEVRARQVREHMERSREL